MLLSLLGLLSVWGQSRAAWEQVQAATHREKLSSLISEWEREERTNTINLSKILRAKGLQKRERAADGSSVEVFAQGADGTPLYYSTLSDPATRASRAQTLYADGVLGLGLDGQGMEVGIWDAGVALGEHQEFNGRAINADAALEISNHATLVTGNLISKGIQPAAQGIAYAAQALTHDWGRDKIEVAQAATKGMLLSNHSYGILSDRVPDWYFGAYIQVSQDWDKIMYNAPYYLMVTAAGNAQGTMDNADPSFGTSQEGFDLLLGFATAKNGLTVAGANTEIGPQGELLDAQVAPYSSFGPVDDGRIKPDVAGDGSEILSTSSASKSSYQISAGTSMATPGVTGTLLLLQQYHRRLFGRYMRAASLKGLVLHTADEVGAPGPDYRMGWGVINAKSAAELLQHREYSSLIQEERLAQGQSYSFSITANGREPLRVSLSWSDPAAEWVNQGQPNLPHSALVNDLDIRVTQGGEPYLPWRLDPAQGRAPASKGDNRVDPYERIELPQAKGDYTITVTHKGQLKYGDQNFSLIVSGALLSDCLLEVPQGLELVALTRQGALFQWETMGEPAVELQFRSQGDGPWQSRLASGNSYELQELQFGGEYQVRLRTLCTENAVSAFTEMLSFVYPGAAFLPETLAALEAPRGSKLSVYPNPTADFLHFGAPQNGLARFSIVGTAGNVVLGGILSGGIDVSTLAEGLYVLVVWDLSGIRSGKFYKGGGIRHW